MINLMVIGVKRNIYLLNIKYLLAWYFSRHTNICGILFSRCIENYVLAYYSFVAHDILWHQTVKKFDVNL